MTDGGRKPRAGRVYAGAAGHWDRRRNTSAVQPVPPGQLERANEAMRRFVADNPRHAAWLAAGAPSIRSQAEHIEWFGEPYTAPARRKRA